MMANAHLDNPEHDVAIFRAAVPVPKEDCKTIIPVTVESANGEQEHEPIRCATSCGIWRPWR